MRTTGITRRIDELGRVVIPKEIRRNMRLREGEEMEIFVDDNKLVLQKFSSLSNLKTYADAIADNLAAITNCTVLVTDTDEVVAAAGALRRDYSGKSIMRQVAKLYYERTVRTLLHGDAMAVTGDDTNVFALQIFAPVTVAGDIVGGVILLSENDDSLSSRLKMTELAARILGGIIQ